MQQYSSSVSLAMDAVVLAEPRGNVMYAAYAFQGNDGQYYPLRSYPALLLGIYSEYDVDTLILIDEVPLGFSTYEEAKHVASWGSRSVGSISLLVLSDGFPDMALLHAQRQTPDAPLRTRNAARLVAGEKEEVA